MDRVKAFVSLPLVYHLVVASAVRLALVAYSGHHDARHDVGYTDVDYRVFTDAARHAWAGRSPYRRHTYRYSPLLAFMLLPNVVLFGDFGKILFSIFDILIAVAVKKLVDHQLASKRDAQTNLISTYCALFWLYNPMSIAISTRGNADSVPCFFVILSILFLQTDVVASAMKYALSGGLLGVAIHLRLYPVVFSFPMYLSLSRRLPSVTFANVVRLLAPNRNQLILALSCIVTLAALTSCMYRLYGYEFLFETYLYHLFRKDTRHNFSIFFYHSYLRIGDDGFDIVKAISQFLEVMILFVMSLSFGGDPSTLPMGLFSQAVVLVTYNGVLTSQYFVWFLSLLPLVAHSFRLSAATAVTLAAIWAAPQAAWLFYAYLLEFKCRQVFIYIWLKSVIFFCANIFVLSELIRSFAPGYGFGLIDSEKDKQKKK